MRIGELYANIAKVGADKMKQETVSIHVITILTLFFLPATFVAVRTILTHVYDLLIWFLTGCQTFFGSGVIDLENGESKGKWGYWVVRWGALKLFGAVCGPLTGLVLLAWAITYFRSWRRSRGLLPI